MIKRNNTPFSMLLCLMILLLSGTQVFASDPLVAPAAKPPKHASIVPAAGADNVTTVFPGYSKEITQVAVTLNGRIALTGDEDENNVLWDTTNGTVLREIGKPDPARIPLMAASFSPDGARLVWVRFKKNTPVVWDTANGKLIGVMSSKEQGHSAEVISVAVSPDGRVMASGDIQGNIVMWNSADRTAIRRFKAHSSDVAYLSFVPGSKEFVSAGADGEVKLWSMELPEAVAVFKDGGSPVTAMTVSRDGSMLYVAASDGTVKGWNLALRTLRGTMSFDDRQINSLDLSADLDWMVLAGEDESLMLWSMRESKVVWKKELNASATFARFLPDGSLITAGGDNWVRVWDAATGKQLRRFAGKGD